MKFGLLSAILDGWDFDEMMQITASHGLKCVEVACWPKGKAERRYAGVSHIDVNDMSKEAIAHIKKTSKATGVEIAALGFYPNNMDANLIKREENIDHLKKVILAANKLGVGTVTTFIGRDPQKPVEDNLAMMADVWKPILQYAKKYKVKIAIENCPMYFDRSQWPGGQNLFTTPVLWDKIFEILDSEYLGINYDPSHFVWQQMDYISPIYDFKDKIFHVHFKDIKVRYDKLKRCGTMAYPLDYMMPKLPGLGDVRWDEYVSALTNIGYEGAACIEIEDKAFEGSKEKILDSITLSKRYLDQFVI